MKYVIKHNFYTDIPYYVRLVDEKTFEEVYNPSFATLFKNNREATDWINTYSSMSDHSKVVEAEGAIKEYDNWANSGTVRRTLSCVNTRLSRFYNGESLDEVIDWWLSYAENADIKAEHYQSWPDLWSLSKHLWDVCSFYDDSCTNLSVSFTVYTRKDGVFEEFEKEIGRVINRVTYKDKEGYLVFPIFDQFLSEGGNSAYLLIHPVTNKVKVSMRWPGDKEFHSLEQAFDYIKMVRYYE